MLIREALAHAREEERWRSQRGMPKPVPVEARIPSKAAIVRVAEALEGRLADDSRHIEDDSIEKAAQAEANDVANVRAVARSDEEDELQRSRRPRSSCLRPAT